MTFTYGFTMKKLKKTQGRLDWLQLLAAILAQWRRPVASTKALDLLHQAMRAVLYWRTASAIKMAIKVGPFFLSSCCLLLPWQPLGWYGASSRLMAASSGFWGSPGHAALGDAVCITPAHRHGHQNGQQWWCICSSSSPLLYHNT